MLRTQSSGMSAHVAAQLFPEHAAGPRPSISRSRFLQRLSWSSCDPRARVVKHQEQRPEFGHCFPRSRLDPRISKGEGCFTLPFALPSVSCTS